MRVYFDDVGSNGQYDHLEHAHKSLAIYPLCAVDEYHSWG